MVEGFEDYSLEEYGDLVLKNNSLTVPLKNIDGLLGFEYEYENPDTKDIYKYFSFVYKTDDAFWMVQFAVLTDNVDEYGSKITEWAKTVSFD